MASPLLELTVILGIACLTVAHGTNWGNNNNNNNCGDCVKRKTCKNSKTVELECSEDDYIEVMSASYIGWMYWRVYWGWRSKYCCDTNAFQKVQSLCDGKTKCEFTCGNDLFNDTACTGNWRGTLKAKYKCVTNPCNTFCCSNGGMCQLTSDMAPICVCNGTWNGTHCDDSPCNYMMCQNNGTCLVNPADGTPQCVCTKDYTGTTCETEMPCNDTQFYENPCDSVMCENNGSCLVNPVNNTAQCCCTADYTGETCETKLDACSTVQCQNGGNCTISITGQAVCQCPTGFIGTFCQVDCNVTQPCPDGFQELPENSGNCYFICNESAQSWLAAEVFCRLRGSVLWEPNTVTEINAVTTELGTEKYWTGAFDGISEGTTVFTGSGLPLIQATTGNSKVKDCVRYERVTVAIGFQFFYRDCTSETGRCICERQDPCHNPAPVISVPVPPIPPFFSSP